MRVKISPLRPAKPVSGRDDMEGNCVSLTPIKITYTVCKRFFTSRHSERSECGVEESFRLRHVNGSINFKNRESLPQKDFSIPFAATHSSRNDIVGSSKPVSGRDDVRAIALSLTSVEMACRVFTSVEMTCAAMGGLFSFFINLSNG